MVVVIAKEASTFSELRDAVFNCTVPTEERPPCEIVLLSNIDVERELRVTGNGTNITFRAGSTGSVLNADRARSRHFRIISGVVSFLGIRFENGQSTGDNIREDFPALGGSIFVDRNGTVDRIEDCSFVNNKAVKPFITTEPSRGGAIYVEGTVNDISGSYFDRNQAGTSGGAIAVKGKFALVGKIQNCTFVSNEAKDGDGGALFSYDGGAIPVIQKSSFRYNALLSTRKRYVAGSAMAFDTGTYRLSTLVDTCSFLEGFEHTSDYLLAKKGSHGRVFIIDSPDLDDYQAPGNGCGLARAPPGTILNPQWPSALDASFFAKANEYDEINTTAWDGALFYDCPVNKFRGNDDALKSLSLPKKCHPCVSGTSAERGSASCEPCAGLFLLSEHCSVPVLGILLGIFLFLTITLLIMFIVTNRRRYKEVLEKKQEELLANLDQVRLLKDTWRINEDDVTFERKVAHGGYGIVWRGRWLQYEVAVKELFPLPSMCEDDDDLDDAEAQSMLNLRHPRIVHFHGAGRRVKINNRRFLVFEWMSGGSLYDMLIRKRFPLPWWWRLRCAIDIAVAVEFLHKSGYAHRDLKSENVLLDSMGRCKVGDFGMTRSTNKRPEAVRGAVATSRKTQLPKLRDAVRRVSNALRAFELPRIRARRRNAKRAFEQSKDNASPDVEQGVSVDVISVLPSPSSKAKCAGVPDAEPCSGEDHEQDSANAAFDTGGAPTLVQGTSRFMAPELYGKNSAAPTFAADVYAFSMILYELATRHLPWGNEMKENPSLDPWRAASEGARPAIDFKDAFGVPAGFRVLLFECWSQNPGDRPDMTSVLSKLRDMTSTTSSDATSRRSADAAGLFSSVNLFSSGTLRLRGRGSGGLRKKFSSTHRRASTELPNMGRYLSRSIDEKAAK